MEITVKTLGEVSDGLKKGVDRARVAMESRNYGYASQILREVLLKEPGLNEARFLLRQAQLEQVGFAISWPRRLLAMVKTIPHVYIIGPGKLRKGELDKALDIAENVLGADPTLLSSLMFARRVARDAGLVEIAVNCMEIAVRFNPKSVAAYRALAQDYQDSGDAKKAVNILRKVCEMQPNNIEAMNDLKHATALGAMEGGRWEQADSYRDLIKDKEKAEDLEQEDRLVVRDPEVRKRLIDKTRALIKETPDSPGHYKRLASLLQQNHDYQEAIDSYQKVMELTGTYDPGIDSQISEILSAQYEQRIRQAREKGGSPESIAELERERDQILLERLEQRVEKFPNDLNFRFELGSLHWQLGQVDEALQQFQQAQRSPHLSRKSQIFMGKCFNRKGLYDLAIEQFEDASTDKARMPASDYKDVLYESGLAYESKGDNEQAYAKFKELYSLDVKYRDVEERMRKYQG